MADTIRTSVLLSPEDLNSLRAAGADVTLLAINSVNPYTGQRYFTGQRIRGALTADAYTDFQGPSSVDGGQRPLPAIDVLQSRARVWGLRHESTIVVYDYDRSMTAARAWWVLKWAGLSDVRVLDGGLPAWQASGLPVTDMTPEAEPSNIVLQGRHMPILDAEGALKMAKDGVLLDARIRPNYIGDSAGRSRRRGHIPGAISAPALDNVTDYGNFADPATLIEMYRVLGVDGKRPVGVYCGAGMSAAHTVLALASIGIPAAMYPGSWSAYVSDPDRPVVIGADPA